MRIYVDAHGVSTVAKELLIRAAIRLQVLRLLWPITG
jgi:hypothetical protein